MNKAQLAMSFNWIFVLIVGIVFLTFFFSLIASQSKVSDQKVSATIAKQFQTILGTTTQKAGTFKTYSTPKIELSFYCDANQAMSRYSLNGKIAGYTTHDVLFSPSNLKGTKLYTWTQEWAYPYQVTNFLYVTNKLHMFIFYSPNEVLPADLENLLKIFPTNLTIFMMNDTHYPTKRLNNNLYTYVFFKNQQPLPDIILTEKSKVIIIEPNKSSNIFDSGKVYFLSGNDLKLNRDLDSFNNSYYFGAASLFGAIFVGEKQQYDCNMEKAFTRLLMLNKMYQYRTTEALKYIPSFSNCQYLYNGTSSLQTGLSQLLDDFSDTLEGGFLNIDAVKFKKLVLDLRNKNNRISSEGGCPGIY